MITTRVNGTLEAAADMTLWGQAKVTGMKNLTRYHGQLLRAKVKARASGRPGPNVVTGDYRRSISLAIEETPGRIAAHVGTDKPQGRRLELGFHGEDSLGRTYNQAPLPHFEPAFQEESEAFASAIAKLIAL